MKCYQLHLELVGCPFPIWRKVVLPAKLTFDDLHDVIQCLFQWEHQHLFEFTVGKYTISDPPDSSIPFSMLELTTPSRMLRAHRTMLLEQIKRRGKFFNMYTTLEITGCYRFKLKMYSIKILMK